MLKFEKGKGDPRRGVHFVRPVDGGEDLLPATLRQLDYRERELTDPGLEVTGQDGASFTVRAKAFAHAVHFGLGDGCPRLGRVLRSPAGGVPEDHAAWRVIGLGADYADQRALMN